MAYAEDWGELVFNLNCLSKRTAKKQFREDIRYSWGGMCAYCRNQRATTLDHLKPRSRGGSSLRSNLIPACTDCNHSKGSESWLCWYQQQEFYSEVAKELIEEWIANKRYETEKLNERHINTIDRTKVCPAAC